MTRYLIEITHSDEHTACVRALRAIEQFGSHFMTHAEWGCPAGVHSGWVVVDLASRDDALLMVPPEFRSEARIVEVSRFSKTDIEALVKELAG